MESRRAAFLDRDGTLIDNVPYCSRVEDVHVIPGAAQAIRLLRAAGLRAVLITNQSAVARGYLTLETLSAIHRHLCALLDEDGAHLDAIYYCPHHPDDHCTCRKPQPGMLFQAAHDLNLDLSASYMVGDAESDMAAARAANCRAVLVSSTQSGPDAGAREADHVARDIGAAAHWIIGEEDRAVSSRRQAVSLRAHSRAGH